MSGLREALEDMVAKADRRAEERRGIGRAEIPARVGIEAIRDLLAAHPVEPAPVARRGEVCACCARPDVYLSSTLSGRWECVSCGEWWVYPAKTPAPVADRQRLAEVLDPDAFDESKPRSKHHAAVVQWAARQHMAYQGADRLLAAGAFREEQP